jgi:alpha-L-fucosidase
MLMAGAAACQTITTPPTQVAKRLVWFQDQKFGLIIHWGPYSQIGCVESWQLSWADRKRANPEIETREQMIDFRKRYLALPRTFNPTAFDPKEWARLARQAGMRYVVFTTKHHDGFCMFDTKLTDYRITSPEVLFSKDPRANVTAEVFRAFRAENFGIGVYFSKPDWHSPYYWQPGVFAETRNPTYDPATDPARWAKFVEFTHGQVKELMTGYGKIDLLWLDGGWVRPPNQDIQMDRMVAMARSYQPDLIVVNRAAKGYYEDYYTPEQKVPDKPDTARPWESCVTMGRRWSYKPDDEYKSTRQLIQMLVDVVAKGGNLLLNVGPQPDGRFPPPAVERLKEIGAWMAVNAEAIHGTRPVAPYREGRLAFTGRGETVYAIYLPEEGEEKLPARIAVPGFRAKPGAKVRLLGSDASIRWRPEGDGTVMELPANTAPPCKYAHTFKISN